jgi:hypothetical protein
VRAVHTRDLGPMLWLIKYFCQKMVKNRHFWLNTLSVYTKLWITQCLYKNNNFLAENSNHNIDPLSFIDFKQGGQIFFWKKCQNGNKLSAFF